MKKYYIKVTGSRPKSSASRLSRNVPTDSKDGYLDLRDYITEIIENNVSPFGFIDFSNLELITSEVDLSLGLTNKSGYRFETTAGFNLRSIAKPNPVRPVQLFLTNQGTGTVQIIDDSGAVSEETDRFRNPGGFNVDLAPDAGMFIWYDTEELRWKIAAYS